MELDLSMAPWDRLAKLAPPGTNVDDLRSAAERWAVTTDVYSAAADVWEEKLMGIDLAPDPDVVVDPENPLANGKVQSISQDGISVSYIASSVDGNSSTARYAQAAQIRGIIRALRAKGKPYSPLVHARGYNPWRNMPQPEDDIENIIVVDEV